MQGTVCHVLFEIAYINFQLNITQEILSVMS